MPGWPSWNRLRPFARTIRVDSVPGRIYDTGKGRPAAVFAGDGSVVEGWIVELHAHLLRQAFAELARTQGEDFREVVVHTSEGAEVVAWEWTAAVDGLHELPGRWRDPERRTG
jgi:hypothetical protein